MIFWLVVLFINTLCVCCVIYLISKNVHMLNDNKSEVERFSSCLGIQNKYYHILTYTLHGLGKCNYVSDMNKCAFMCLYTSRRHGYGVFVCATTTTSSANGYSVQDTGGHDQYFTHCMIVYKTGEAVMQIGARSRIQFSMNTYKTTFVS
jgi:hypothetical protein